MPSHRVEAVCGLVACGKGILAAHETPRILTRRFDALGMPPAPESRRAYRKMLLTARGGPGFLSGVIRQDDTIRQTTSKGWPFANAAAALPPMKTVSRHSAEGQQYPTRRNSWTMPSTTGSA